ncbi:MAG: replicative DNA helicase [Alphaproteobacteria bacterium GM202ARS2]|nr:replicative DNA helicase [Alphaproteobacteria bacterium GM202ARS2]
MVDSLHKRASPMALVSDSASGKASRGFEGEGGGGPYDREMERALLGTLLVNNSACERVNETLKGFHFVDEAHGKIYDAIMALVSMGRVADHQTLRHHLSLSALFGDEDGAGYLADLAQEALLTANVKHYGEVIEDLYQRRALIQLAHDMAREAQGGALDNPATTIAESAEKRLYDLSETEDQRVFQPFDEVLSRAVEHAKVAAKRKVSGLATHLRDLDGVMGGLQSSDLIIVAARPSVGKSALAMNIAWSVASVAQEGEPVSVAFFSLEMSAEQLAFRVLSEESGISSDSMRRGKMGKGDLDNLYRASQRIEKAPLFIDDTPGLSLSVLRRRARRLKRTKGLGLLVVDYLQLMQGEGRQGWDNRVQEISEISRGLKGIAKELNIPVIAVSQLSRKVEDRTTTQGIKTGGIPQLSDLRESGSIEQDADVVIFIHREDYLLERMQPQEGTKEHEAWQEKMAQVHNKARLIVAKNRNGSIGKADVFFDKHVTRFKNLAKDDLTEGR